MTTTYTDKKGRLWDLELDLLICKRIDASDFSEVTDLKFSILKPERPLYHRLLTDAKLLFAVIWVIVQPQVEQMHAASLFPISPKEDLAAAELEFISGVNGQAVQDARKAIMEAFSGFFPEQRTVLSLILRQQDAVIQTLSKKEEKMETLLQAELEATVEEGLEKARLELQRTRGEQHGESSIQLPRTVVSNHPNSSDLDILSDILLSPTTPASSAIGTTQQSLPLESTTSPAS